jgi:hypothetical protein
MRFMPNNYKDGNESSEVHPAGTSFFQTGISEIDRKVLDDLSKSKEIIEKIFEDLKKYERKV